MFELAALVGIGVVSLLASRSRRAWVLRDVSSSERPPLASFPPEYGSTAVLSFQNITDPTWLLEARVQCVEPNGPPKKTTTGLMLDDVGLDFPKGTFIEFGPAHVLRLEAPAVR
jgi:hypothetical protein